MPTNFEVAEIISSIKRGFYAFEQKFEVVLQCPFLIQNLTQAWLPKNVHTLNSLAKVNLMGYFKTFLSALVQLFLYLSHEQFAFIDDGELVVVPEKNTTRSCILEFLENQQIPEKSLEEVSSVAEKGEVPSILQIPSSICKCTIDDAKGECMCGST